MTVGVYGLGRFGRFWASLLARNYRVLVANRTPRQAPDGTELVETAELGECEALFLCVAISALDPVARRLDALVPVSVPFIDTCSVKLHPHAVFSALSPQRGFLLTHPMFGPDSGRDGVEGLPMIVCEGSVSEEYRAEWIRRFEAYGLDVLQMTAAEHDKEAAFTQGITHFVGRVLADLRLSQSEIGTVGYRRLLQVMEQTCNDPYQLFVDLQRFNPYTSDMRSDLAASISRIMGSLEANIDTDHNRR